MIDGGDLCSLSFILKIDTHRYLGSEEDMTASDDRSSKIKQQSDESDRATAVDAKFA